MADELATTHGGAIVPAGEQSGDLATASTVREVELARAEIESAITVARKLPRCELAACAAIEKACTRLKFADAATYSFPRGGKTIKGPSVYLAREAARCWGNVRHGLYITQDDARNRTIRGWAWDLQTNMRVELEDTFAKLIQRKRFNKTTRQSSTEWVEPDERDLRELTNRRGAMTVRNCILQLIPQDIIDTAIEKADQTLLAGVSSNPDDALKELVAAFVNINISSDMLAEYLNHPVKQVTPAEVVELRGVWRSVRDGNTKWADHMEGPKTDEPTKPQAETAALKTARANLRERFSKLPGPDAIKALSGAGIESLGAVGKITDTAVLQAGVDSLQALSDRLDQDQQETTP